MADAPVTKKDLDAPQKTLQKQLDDLRKWAKDEDDARVKTTQQVVDGVNKSIEVINKDIKSLTDAVNDLIRRANSK